MTTARSGAPGLGRTVVWSPTAKLDEPPRRHLAACKRREAAPDYRRPEAGVARGCLEMNHRRSDTALRVFTVHPTMSLLFIARCTRSALPFSAPAVRAISSSSFSLYR